MNRCAFQSTAAKIKFQLHSCAQLFSFVAATAATAAIHASTAAMLFVAAVTQHSIMAHTGARRATRDRSVGRAAVHISMKCSGGGFRGKLLKYNSVSSRSSQPKRNQRWYNNMTKVMARMPISPSCCKNGSRSTKCRSGSQRAKSVSHGFVRIMVKSAPMLLKCARTSGSLSCNKVWKRAIPCIARGKPGSQRPLSRSMTASKQLSAAGP